jgi:hypothetical protein
MMGNRSLTDRRNTQGRIRRRSAKIIINNAELCGLLTNLSIVNAGFGPRPGGEVAASRAV